MDNSGGKVLALAFALSQFGFMIAGGLLLGLWGDRKWGTSPWLGLVGLLSGIVIGVKLLIKIAQEKSK